MCPPLRATVLRHCWLCTSQRRTVSSWEPESSTLPSVDTDRQVTWFLGTDRSPGARGGGGGRHSDPHHHLLVDPVPVPVPSEHLPVVLLRLEALFSLPGLRKREGR